MDTRHFRRQDVLNAPLSSVPTRGEGETQLMGDRVTTVVSVLHAPTLHCTMRQPTVLVVDDDEYLREFLTVALCPEGYHVVRAVDGIDALQKAEATVPDVILMDLCLPGLDGCAATRWLKARPHTRGIPVIAMSGRWTSQEGTAWAQAACCAAFFTKPLMVDDVIRTIRALIGGRAH